MNMLKKFMRKDNVDLENEDELDYGDYIMPDDVGMDIPEEEVKDDTSALDSPARKNPEIRSASAADLVSLKLLQPKSHTEAIKIADKLKEGCIVLLDISNLSKEQAPFKESNSGTKRVQKKPPFKVCSALFLLFIFPHFEFQRFPV